MKHIFKNRLFECNIDENDIVLAIEDLDKNDAIVIYTSHLEGLGTKDSDFDIYVISDRDKNLSWFRDNGVFKVQNKLIKNKYFDIEYWKLDDIEKIIQKNNSEDIGSLSIDSLKLIQRLFIGVKINNTEMTNKLIEKLEESNFKKQVIKLYTVYANSDLEDAINLFNSKEYPCALKCARDALDNAIAALNAKNNFPNLKSKWIPKIFINNKGYTKKNLETYLRLQIMTSINNDNIHDHIEEMLEFTQNILSSIAVDYKTS